MIYGSLRIFFKTKLMWTVALKPLIFFLYRIKVVY